ALGDPVEAAALPIGTGLAESRDRAVDDTRVDRAHVVVAEPEAGRRARAEVLQDDVGPGRQREPDRPAGGRLQVERDASLVAVVGHEGRALAADLRRYRARVVADARPLELDHVGAEVAEQHGAVGPGELGGDVQYAQAVEGEAASRHPRDSLRRDAAARKPRPLTGAGGPGRPRVDRMNAVRAGASGPAPGRRCPRGPAVLDTSNDRVLFVGPICAGTHHA